jgi:hypothetical protein
MEECPMPAEQNELPGLTRLILDSLWAMHAELIESGQGWSKDLLDQVEKQVYQRLSPGGTERQRLIFDMVFNRAFAEAKEICMAMTAFIEADGDFMIDAEPAVY